MYEQDRSTYLTSAISTRNINHSHQDHDIIPTYLYGSTLARPSYSKLLTLDTIEHRDRISLLLDIQLKNINPHSNNMGKYNTWFVMSIPTHHKLQLYSDYIATFSMLCLVFVKLTLQKLKYILSFVPMLKSLHIYILWSTLSKKFWIELDSVEYPNQH